MHKKRHARLLKAAVTITAKKWKQCLFNRMNISEVKTKVLVTFCETLEVKEV